MLSVSSKIEFRVASTLPEMEALEPLAKEALAESRFGKAKFSSRKFSKVIGNAEANQGLHGILYATLRGNPVGALYCGIGEPLVGENLLITTVHVLFVPLSLRSSLLGGRIANGLLNGALSWSKARNGQEVLLHLTSGIKLNSSSRFLRRRGFRMIGLSLSSSVIGSRD